MPDELTPSEIGRALGRINSPRKQANARAQAVLARAARKPVKPCTCGRTDSTHAHTCPEYRRQAIAKYRAKKKAGDAQP